MTRYFCLDRQDFYDLMNKKINSKDKILCEIKTIDLTIFERPSNKQDFFVELPEKLDAKDHSLIKEAISKSFIDKNLFFV